MLFYPYLLPIWEQHDLQHFHLEIFFFSFNKKLNNGLNLPHNP